MPTPYRAGLVVLAILSLADISTPLITDGETPPMSIALIAAALGVASLGCAWLARTGARVPAYALIAMRLVSALAAVPGVVFDGVPAPVRVLAGAGIAATLVGAGLVMSGLRRPVAAVTA